MKCLMAVLLLTAAVAAERIEEWTPAHSMKVRTVSEVTPSPNGERVVWTETRAVISEDKSEYLTHIHLARSDGSGRRQLTRGDKSATSPQFSFDGLSVLFASERSGKRNVYRIPVDGGEAEMLTDWKGALGDFAVSPDGRQLAFAGAEEDKEEEKKKKGKTDYKIVDDKPRNHSLWVMPLDGELPGKARKLFEAAYHVGRFDWSPDSSRIAFEHRLRPDADDARKADLAEVEVATGNVRPLAASGDTEVSPRYSPDGRYLAFLGTGEGRRLEGRIRLLDLRSGSTRELPPTADESPSLIGWTRDSRGLLFSEVRGTRGSVFQVPVDGLAAVVISTTRGTVGGARLSLSGSHLGWIMQSPEDPPEAYVAAFDGKRGGKPVQVSAANTNLARPPLGRTELIRWKSKDGREIEGLLTYPAGQAAGGKVPLILNIHGGPSGVFVESFSGLPGPYPVASFAAKGFAVLRPNPRGSSGYGADSRRAVVQDWGGRDFEDLMSGVDHVIGMGVADPGRLAVMGWSYGGYMTAWTVTQTTRFRAAAVGAGITNHVSMYGTQDIPSVYEDYFGGTPWEQKAVYARSSPMEFVHRVKTPTLLLHGENDRRVPIGQAYEFHRALKRQGVEVQMVAYPRMPHGPNEPKFLQDIMERHLAWVEKHLP